MQHVRLTDEQYSELVAEVAPIARQALETAKSDDDLDAALERCTAIINQRHADIRRARAGAAHLRLV